jgi:hypothetical protein
MDSRADDVPDFSSSFLSTSGNLQINMTNTILEQNKKEDQLGTNL